MSETILKTLMALASADDMTLVCFELEKDAGQAWALQGFAVKPREDNARFSILSGSGRKMVRDGWVERVGKQKVGHITFYEYELTEAGRNALAHAK
jgi:hypothetical protein